MSELRLDEVGYWTEIKLHILREYSSAYAKIMQKQTWLKHCAYIDGFAGPGVHISKNSGKEIAGSPAIALGIPFSHYHFIDMDGTRVAALRKLAEGRDNVSVYQGDCNEVLLNQVFPQCRYEEYRRALCLLDPYQLNPNWEVVSTAGKMKSVEIFLNFMIMDVNMNALHRNREAVPPAQVARMDRFWGDRSWREVGYKNTQGLFGTIAEKTSNEALVTAYQQRLKEVAGFKYVPKPIPMRNKTGATIYYLFFASNNETGANIARDVFKKYREAGANGH